MRAPSNGDAFMCVRIDPPKQEDLVCLSPANWSDLSLSLLVGTYQSAVHSFGVVMRVTAFLLFCLMRMTSLVRALIQS